MFYLHSVQADTQELKEKLTPPKCCLTIGLVCEQFKQYPWAAGDPSEWPVITFYNISPEVQQTAELLFSLKDSVVFNKLWVQYCKIVKDEPVDYYDGQIVTLQNVVEHIWHPCQKQWNIICGYLYDGCMPVELADKNFGVFKEDYIVMEEQIKIMLCWHAKRHGHAKNDDEILRVVRDRLSQYKIYKKFGQYKVCVKEILHARELLGLSGNFSDLETLLLMVSDHVHYVDCHSGTVRLGTTWAISM